MSFDPKTKLWIWKRYDLDFIEIKNFCSAKDTVNRIKRQATDREKIFANSEKGLLIRI